MTKVASVGNQIRKKPNWDLKIITVYDYLTKWHPNTDCNPVHQRRDVENIGTESSKRLNASKRQAIVETILDGLDIGEIKINKRTPQEIQKWGKKYESIDGGHRKRTISAFFENKFRTAIKSSNSYKIYGELPQDVQEEFLNYKIRLVVYNELLPKQKRNQWGSTNHTTPANHQEELNSYGDYPLANCIRELVSYIGGPISNSIHPIFKTKKDKNGKEIGEVLSFAPERMSYDRLVARMLRVALYCNKKTPLVTCDDIQIEEMYADGETLTIEEINRARAKVIRWLDFMLEWANAKYNVIKGKFTMDEFIMMFRLIVTYEMRWGDYKVAFRIVNWDKFYERSAKSFNQFFDKNPSPYGMEQVNTTGSPELRYKQFSANLRKHGVIKRWTESVEWFEHNYMTPDELVGENIILLLDKKRVFSKKVREHGIINMDFMDDSGNRLDLQNSHAGHRKPHSKGGKTNMDNLVVQTAEENLKLGARDYDTHIAGSGKKVPPTRAKKTAV